MFLSFKAFIQMQKGIFKDIDLQNRFCCTEWFIFISYTCISHFFFTFYSLTCMTIKFLSLSRTLPPWTKSELSVGESPSPFTSTATKEAKVVFSVSLGVVGDNLFKKNIFTVKRNTKAKPTSSLCLLCTRVVWNYCLDDKNYLDAGSNAIDRTAFGKVEKNIFCNIYKKIISLCLCTQHVLVLFRVCVCGNPSIYVVDTKSSILSLH